MDRWETGMLAKSLVGHDKDKVYVIVGLDEQFTYLADGERKTLQSPKKKKKKHVQLQKYVKKLLKTLKMMLILSLLWVILIQTTQENLLVLLMIIIHVMFI